MSWLWVALLALAVAVLVAAEWPRLDQRLGPRERRRGRARARTRRKPSLQVVTSDEQDDFAASVERDLSLLPTIDDDDR